MSAAVMLERPPLELGMELRAADGSRAFRWAPDEPDPTNRPLGFRFSTARWDGFKTADLTFRRDILTDWPDLGLLDDLTAYGFDGSTAFEGRLHGQPRTTAGGHQINVGAVGWMSHAKDRRFAQIFVDTDLGRWAPITTSYRATLLGVPYTNIQGPNITDVLDSDGPALQLSMVFSDTSRPYAGAQYDAGSARIGSVYGAFATSGNWTPPTSRYLELALLGDGTADVSADLEAASGSATVTATTTTRSSARVQWFWNAAATGPLNATYDTYWRQLAVYGNHGLTLRDPVTAGDPQGVYASDVITWLIENYCPKLNAGGVQATTYPIGQLAFHDRTTIYDAFLRTNQPHLWGLECWEGRTVHYGPADLTDYDWQVRTSAVNVDVSLQGDSTEDLVSGLEVQYTDVRSGRTETLLPADHDELRDDSVENPFNRAGYPGEDTITLSSPTTADMALELGRVALAERNQPKAPGTINVRGHIQDRAGNWHPVWKVRAGQTIALVDHPNDRPRMILETDYSHDSRQLSIAVDSSFKRLDAVLDRFGTALAAHNLAA